MGNKEVVIQALDLTKSYGKILAVDHINFGVESGEIFGFLGPNELPRVCLGEGNL